MARTIQTDAGAITVNEYISQFLDPNGELRRGDDAEEVWINLDYPFAGDGGCGVTVEEIDNYLAALPDEEEG